MGSAPGPRRPSDGSTPAGRPCPDATPPPGTACKTTPKSAGRTPNPAAWTRTRPKCLSRRRALGPRPDGPRLPDVLPAREPLEALAPDDLEARGPRPRCAAARCSPARGTVPVRRRGSGAAPSIHRGGTRCAGRGPDRTGSRRPARNGGPGAGSPGEECDRSFSGVRCPGGAPDGFWLRRVPGRGPAPGAGASVHRDGARCARRRAGRGPDRTGSRRPARNGGPGRDPAPRVGVRGWVPRTPTRPRGLSPCAWLCWAGEGIRRRGGGLGIQLAPASRVTAVVDGYASPPAGPGSAAATSSSW